MLTKCGVSIDIQPIHTRSMCIGYTTYARSVNTGVLIAVIQGAAKDKHKQHCLEASADFHIKV